MNLAFRPRHPHVYTRFYRLRRVMTAAVAAALLVATTALVGRMLSGI